jgi:putative phosphoribosyl transferase
MIARFRDRFEAGQILAQKLSSYQGRDDVLVLALPRGGVPVAFEVARALGAPLDIFMVRKLGLPFHEELAMGAIASGGVRLIDDSLVRQFGISDADIAAVTATEEAELERRERQYRGDRPFPDVTGLTVILVDDGLATGSSMRAAVAALRLEHPARIVVAVPIAPPETCAALRKEAEDVVCALTPEPFFAVGLWYQDFTQTTDDEVRDLLERARQESPSSPRGNGRAGNGPLS